MVGNGSRIHCDRFYPNVPITLQSNLFHIPFYLLPIEGADVVLGMEWLKTLGPIGANFSIPSISFSHNYTTITLTGEQTSHPTQSTYHFIRHLVHTDSIASLHIMTCSSTIEPQQPTPPNTEILPADFPHDIRSLLHTYKPIFQTPHGLPCNTPFSQHVK
jgi:hypothetical protein